MEDVLGSISDPIFGCFLVGLLGRSVLRGDGVRRFVVGTSKYNDPVGQHSLTPLF